MNRTTTLIAALGAALLVACAAIVLLPKTDAAPRGAAPKPRQAPAAPVLRDLPPIVFASNRSQAYELFAIGPGGGDPVRVTDEPGMYPAWSPDGTALVFVGEGVADGHADEAHAGDPGGTDPHGHPGAASRRPELRRIAADGTVESLLGGTQVPSHPSVRAVDGAVAYQSTLLELAEVAGSTGHSTIDTVDARGRRRTLVEHRGAAYQPAWSPDGTRLAVVLGRAGCRSEAPCRQRLELLNPHKRTGRTIVGRGAAAAPAWSPDGTSIAFTWDRGDGPSVWTVDARTGARERLSHGAAGDAEPTWSPDGHRIAFMRDCDIYVQRLGERRATNVTRTPRTCEISPTWRPSA